MGARMLGNKFNGLEKHLHVPFVFSAHAGNILEYSADDVHPVVDIDKIHCRNNQQGCALDCCHGSRH